MKRLEDWKEETLRKKAELEKNNISFNSQQAIRRQIGQIKVLERELLRIDYLKANVIRQRPLVETQRKVLRENIPLGLSPEDYRSYQ